MKSRITAPRWIIALLAGMISTLLGWEFTPPTEETAAFRRDKIPLNVESIGILSKQLEVMARGLSGESAKERRGTAQMLALSLALDPVNITARELIRDYKENHQHSELSTELLQESRANIWHTIEWLEKTDAGNHGQALADCLKDVIILSDPQHPRSATLRESGEKGNWTGWIPPTSAYEDKPKSIENFNAEKSNKQPTNTHNPIIPKLDHAEILTVLWKNAGSSDKPKWKLALAPLQMSVKKIEGFQNSENQPLVIHIGSDGVSSIFANINSMLVSLLTTQHKKLPTGIRININSNQLTESISSRKQQSISAASSVLASSAITGTEPEAIVIGQMDKSGAYTLPSGFWNQIRSLDKGQGQRLILPYESSEIMLSLLSMEKVNFFLEYEVLAAKNFTELLAYSAKKTDLPTARALEKFQELIQKSKNQDVRSYINNRFVRQRLAEIIQEAPYHLSAKMLLLQAEGKRPSLITRKVLASEILAAMEVITWLSRNPELDLNPAQIAKLDSTHDSYRSAIDSLERYADRADRPLINQSKNILSAIRNIEKATKTRGEYYMVNSLIRSARFSFILQFNQIRQSLSIEAGDSPNP